MYYQCQTHQQNNVTDHILTDELRKKLLANGRAQMSALATGEEIDFVPVVKLVDDLLDSCWILTEIDPENPDMAYGLLDECDGCPEIGTLSLSDLEERNSFGYPTIGIEYDWQPLGPLSAYADAAKANGHIVDLDEAWRQYVLPL